MSLLHPYSSEKYVAALATNDAGIIHIKELGIWAMLRKVSGTKYFDAIGSYPYSYISRSPSKSDFYDFLRRQNVISFVMVTDPLQSNCEKISDIFEIARPYKTHYVVDLEDAVPQFSSHHRYEIRKAKLNCETRQISLADYLGDWKRLYNQLSERHQLGDLHRFSPAYFDMLSSMPEIVSFGAFSDDRLVSCQIWLVHEDSVYCHLGASSPLGYELSASYAAYSHAISYFQDYRVVILGGAPDKSKNGLARFKQGFSNATRQNWIFGAITNRELYETTCVNNGVDPEITSYFPAYRAAS